MKDVLMGILAIVMGIYFLVKVIENWKYIVLAIIAGICTIAIMYFFNINNIYKGVFTYVVIVLIMSQIFDFKK